MIMLVLARASDDDGMWTFLSVLIGFVLPAAALIGGLFYRDWRRNLRIREQNIQAGLARQEQEKLAFDAQREQRQREELAYKQHVSLNDLTAQKFEAETKLLEAQLAAMERDQSARERDEEFHKLMVQKTRLEIQSLQLHIREQRKRIDDFTSYDDE